MARFVFRVGPIGEPGDGRADRARQADRRWRRTQCRLDWRLQRIGETCKAESWAIRSTKRRLNELSGFSISTHPSLRLFSPLRSAWGQALVPSGENVPDMSEACPSQSVRTHRPVVVFAPQPDNDVIGCAGTLSWLVSQRVESMFVHVADGARREFGRE